jgi:hypothetical protein
MPADEAPNVSQHEELQPLLERADASGVIEAGELREALEILDLDPIDVETLQEPRCSRRRRTPCSSSCGRSAGIRS